MTRYVISDIHGCAQTLKALLEQLVDKQTPQEFYFLGDYINKGPDSKAVLDLLMDFSEQHTCFFLRGNHDQLLLDIQHQANADEWWMGDYQRVITLESFGVESPKNIPERYLEFIRQMYWYIELEHCFLVHAGFDFTADEPYSIHPSMLNIKNFPYDATKAKGKKVIHGHIPRSIAKLKEAIACDAPTLGIDTGCAYIHNEQYRFLTAINMDTYELFHQANCDGVYQIHVKPS